MNPIGPFLSELTRRRAVRVAAGYTASALAVIEITNNVFPAINLPEWTVRFVVVLALLGLPIALGLAWAFDVTPEGAALASDGPDALAGGRPRSRPSTAARAM